MRQWQTLMATGIELFLAEHNTSAELEANTPRRVIMAWQELVSGYDEDPAQVLSKAFDTGTYDEMIHVSRLPIRSTCEHHVMPIIGEAHFAYIPDGKIVGLSKLPRFIDILCRRLQVQERLTADIVDVFQDTVKPFGCACTISALHCCMMSRGVKVHDAVTRTTALRGSIKSDGRQREEYFAAIPKDFKL